MRILIIDSSIHVMQRLEEMILAVNVASFICISDSYETGLQIFIQNKPDVVLLGISLPENRCIKLLEEIKKDFLTVPVIILSISTNAELHYQCLQLGADYFLDKYYEFEKIPAVIMEIAGNRI